MLSFIIRKLERGRGGGSSSKGLATERMQSIYTTLTAMIALLLRLESSCFGNPRSPGTRVLRND